MSISTVYQANLTTAETLETGVPAASDKSLSHSGFNTSATINASSTPPGTKCAFFRKALESGSATIDLTALVGTNGAAVNGTGLRVQAIKFKAVAGNAAAITIAKGSSNGYDGLGAAFSLTLAATSALGAEVMIRTADAGSDIGSANKTLDLSGSGTDAVDVAVILG
jgi:hypothetical protein